MYKPTQRLKVIQSGLRDERGHFVPKDGRVVVLHVEGDTITARRADFKRTETEKFAARIVASASAFVISPRGRPTIQK